MLVHFFFMEDKYIWPRKFSGKKECFLLKASHRHNPGFHTSAPGLVTCKQDGQCSLPSAKTLCVMIFH